MNKKQSIFAMFALASILVGSLTSCGDEAWNSGDGTTGGGGTTTTPTSAIYLGSGSGTTYKRGILYVQTTSLPAGGSTTITASVVDENAYNTLYATSVDVTFSSPCVAAGKATFSASPAKTVNGTVTVTYTAQGCSGTDTITATATLDNVVRQAVTTPALTIQPLTARLGNGSGTSFVNGALALGLSTISSGGSTTVAASIVDANAANALYTTPVPITFSSACAAAGTADITSPASTVNGEVMVTYTAMGCAGTDAITANATVNAVPLTASATVTLLPPNVGSLEFVSATPTSIGLAGTGLNETADVVFRVLDTSGSPLSGQTIDFSLSTTLGGITLLNSSATSASDGKVTARLHSGTVATTVSVIATKTGSVPVIATQSSGIIVSTGVSHQNGMSLSASKLNVEGWTTNNNTVTFSVIASDHYQNPVPDGTTVYFTAEGGQIDPSCTISRGACSVTWRSADPRPSDGRATILAVMSGEESYSDINPNNGRYDTGEPFVDLGEAFLDVNENGTRDADEPYRDFDSSGSYSGPDGLYNGLLCNSSCGTLRTIENRRSIVLVMSSSEALASLDKPAFTITAGTETTDTVNVTVSDLNGQPMAAGTTITFNTSNGKLISPASVTVPSTNFNGPLVYPVTIQGDKVTSLGFFTFSVRSASGVTTSFGPIPVND